MTKPTIGFIGLGLMGGAMVANLQDRGYPLHVLGNRDRTELDKAIARGATEAPSPKALAEASDIIMLCVGTSVQVEGRMRGPDGIIAGLAEVAAVGAAYMDAPIGKTPQQARDGKINLMCAGDKATFDRMEPVLKEIGENVFHLGALGNGHTIKLINNFFGQTVANALAEAWAVADVAGVDRKDVYDVMSSGPLGSPFMTFMAAYALDGDPTKLAFSIKNAGKDVGYYDQMCSDASITSLMAKAPLEALRDAEAKGKGEAMVPELLDYFVDRLKGG